jgi:acetoin utilization deacetylase AcuC-like enzyme
MRVRAHPDCLGHVPSLGHPDPPLRQRVVLEALSGVAGASWQVEEQAVLPAEDDVVGVLAWLHERDHVERVRAAAAAAPGFIDSADCVVSAGTFRASLAAAGLSLQSALDVVNRRLRRGFLVTRPPGHHAEPDRAHGFCFFNNVALAAEVVVRAVNAPVLIVDFDVHHGNGTQRMFYDRAEVGYLSVHQYPLFPGTGQGDEIGEGAGRGTTLNLPLAAGADDEVYAAALEHGLEELGHRLRPVALLVSAGFDAHQDDPLGGMELSYEGFRRMSAAIVQAAATWCEGRVLSFLEGGHRPTALGACARVHVEELARGVDGDSPSN